MSHEERVMAGARPRAPDRQPARASGLRAGRESDWIGRRLREVYSQVLAEPLPPKFLAAIAAIGARERDDRGN